MLCRLPPGASSVPRRDHLRAADVVQHHVDRLVEPRPDQPPPRRRRPWPSPHRELASRPRRSRAHRRCAASWTANRPTPPEAPVISTRLPRTVPAARSARNAASPATGNAAASARSTDGGTSASALTSTATALGEGARRQGHHAGAHARARCHRPRPAPPHRRHPSRAPRPARTRPDRASLRSPWFSETWCTSSSTWLGPATGSGTSAKRSAAGADGSTMIARIGSSPAGPRRCGYHNATPAPQRGFRPAGTTQRRDQDRRLPPSLPTDSRWAAQLACRCSDR